MTKVCLCRWGGPRLRFSSVAPVLLSAVMLWAESAAAQLFRPLVDAKSTVSVGCSGGPNDFMPDLPFAVADHSCDFLESSLGGCDVEIQRTATASTAFTTATFLGDTMPAPMAMANASADLTHAPGCTPGIFSGSANASAGVTYEMRIGETRPVPSAVSKIPIFVSARGEAFVDDEAFGNGVASARVAITDGLDGSLVLLLDAPPNFSTVRSARVSANAAHRVSISASCAVFVGEDLVRHEVVLMNECQAVADPAFGFDQAVFDQLMGADSFPLADFFAFEFSGNLPAGFDDVPADYWARAWIEALVNAGVTAGCSTSPRLYCPESPVTREQMAIFLLRGMGVTPPPCTTAPFPDVPCSSPFAASIAELVRRGITAGCGGGLYCPTAPVTREQMAVFLLRAIAVTPPACMAPTFADVSCASVFAHWIQELVRRGITAGCGGGLYCPRDAVTRAQMAVFLAKTFNLPF